MSTEIKKGIKPRSAKQKGNLLEDFVVKTLQDSGLDQRAYRQKGSGGGLNKGDIWNALDLHVECKNWKNFCWKPWKEQMARDNVSNHPEVLIWHPRNTPLESSVVILPLDFFIELLKCRNSPAPVTENPKLRWPLQRLKQAVQEVLRSLPEE